MLLFSEHLRLIRSRAHLMQFWGSASQSMLHINLSQCNQPMVGVNARPLSSDEAGTNKDTSPIKTVFETPILVCADEWLNLKVTGCYTSVFTAYQSGANMHTPWSVTSHARPHQNKSQPYVWFYLSCDLVDCDSVLSEKLKDKN